MSNETKLSKIRKKERLNTKPNISEALEDAGKLPEGWAKLGDEYNQCSVGPDGIHIQGGKQVIQSGKEGTRVSAGKKYTVKVPKTTDFKLELDDGTYNLHPKSNQGSSSAAFPRETFSQTISTDILQIAKLADTVKKILELF